METNEAEALWASLRSALYNADNSIKHIIAEKAWRPLGYETFAQAWDERMAGIELANSIKPYVIYAMLDESLTLDDIAGMTGWGMDQVSRAAEDYRYGVPVAGATVVRRHVRQAPSGRTTMHIQFDPSEYEWLRDFAKRQGRDLAREARQAVIAHFKSLETRASTVRVP
jgi:hypothetical protein